MQSGPGFVPTFLYYFVGTTFIVAFVVSKGLDTSELTGSMGNPLQVGILFGCIAGGLGAYLNSHDSVELPVKNRGAFSQKLNDTLTAMGYSDVEEVDAIKVYKRPFPSSLFSGKVFVAVDNKQAIISGRSSSIRKLQKRLEV